MKKEKEGTLVKGFICSICVASPLMQCPYKGAKIPFGIYPKCAVQNIWEECWWVSTVQTFCIFKMFLCQDVNYLILSPIICYSRVSDSLVCVFRSLKKCRIKSLLLFCRMSLNSHWHCCLSLKRSRWEPHTYSSGIQSLGLIRHASHTRTLSCESYLRWGNHIFQKP